MERCLRGAYVRQSTITRRRDIHRCDVGTSPREELDALPDFLREKVQASQEYGIRFLGLGSSEHESVGGSVAPTDIVILSWCWTNCRAYGGGSYTIESKKGAQEIYRAPFTVPRIYRAATSSAERRDVALPISPD